MRRWQIELEDETKRASSWRTSPSTRRCYRTCCAENSEAVSECQPANKVCSDGTCRSAGRAGFSTVYTSTYHYKPRRRGQADLEQRIKEIAEMRMRYGYRRVHVVLQREGWMTNINEPIAFTQL